MEQNRVKVFNIGLNRAGTSSLTQALKVLGYRAVHYRHGTTRLADIIDANLNAGRRLLTDVEHDYDAFSDFAGERFFQLLDEQYPGSKFIVTLRDLDGWLDSRERKVLQNRANPDYRHNFLEVDRPGWTRTRTETLERIGTHFRGRDNDLLYIDIPAGEGWSELCRFLNTAVPDRPFPWTHKSGS